MLWMDAVKKEMEAVRIAFKIIGENEPLPGYQEIPCHLIFTIKMEDFRRKARYITGGHRTEAPATLTYASVVSRDTVHIALTLAALNGLEVKTSDIQNAYLTAPCAEKIWTRLGPEFGPDQGRRAIIVSVERISLGSLRQSLRITVALSLILVLFSVGYGVPISQYVSIYSLIYYEQRSLRDRSTTR